MVCSIPFICKSKAIDKPQNRRIQIGLHKIGRERVPLSTLPLSELDAKGGEHLMYLINCTPYLGATARMAPFSGLVPFVICQKKKTAEIHSKRCLLHCMFMFYSTASRESKMLGAPLRCVRTDSTKAWPP